MAGINNTYHSIAAGAQIALFTVYASDGRMLIVQTRMWASTQRDGRPAEYTWRPLLNAAKFG